HRERQPGARRCRGHIGASRADPSCRRPDAQAPAAGTAAVSIAPSSAERRRLRYRLRRVIVEAGAVTLGLTLLIWSLATIYNMLMIALDPEEGENTVVGHIWPTVISFNIFRV